MIIPTMKTYTLRFTPPENTPLPSPCTLNESIEAHQMIVVREDRPYTHYHFYVVTDLSIVTLRKRFKAWSGAKGNKGYSIHPVDSCSRHKNCHKFSLAYCVKEGNVVYRIGVSKAQLSKAIENAKELVERKRILLSLKGKPSWYRCYIMNKEKFDNLNQHNYMHVKNPNVKLILKISYDWYVQFHTTRPTEFWCKTAVDNIVCLMYPLSREKHFQKCLQYVRSNYEDV